MSCVTLADVKLNNEYNHIFARDPLTTDNQAGGFTIGDTWINSDSGETFAFTSELAGSATWTQYDQSKDNLINDKIPKTCALVFDWLRNGFELPRDNRYSGEIYRLWKREETLYFLQFESIFAEWVFDSTGKTATANPDVYGDITQFEVGDKVYLSRGLRNSGILTIAAIDTTNKILTFDETIIDETVTAFFALSVIPSGLASSIAGLIWYDVYARVKGGGVKSERFGNYSYTLGNVSVGGLGYPDEIIAPLLEYQGAAIGGETVYAD